MSRTTTTERPQSVAAQVTVTSVEDISPSFRRLRVASPELAQCTPQLIGTGDEITCRDAYLKLLVPPPGSAPVRPDLSRGLPEWFALPSSQRGWLRTYTARSARWIELDGQCVPEVAIDIAMHERDAGPGGLWACAARPGSTAHLLAPARDVPMWASWDPGEAARVIVVGDETAAPALMSIAEELLARRPQLRADILLEVPDEEDAAAYPPASIPRAGTAAGTAADGGLRLHMLARGEQRPLGHPSAERLAEILGLPRAAVDTVLAGQRPTPAAEDTGILWSLAGSTARNGTYIFLAGEASCVKAWRRLCVDAGGCPKDAVSFMGYWRRGRAES